MGPWAPAFAGRVVHTFRIILRMFFIVIAVDCHEWDGTKTVVSESSELIVEVDPVCVVINSHNANNVSYAHYTNPVDAA